MTVTVPRLRKIITHSALGFITLATSNAVAKFTTDGQDIVDRESGEKVLLRGFGLGCWLLPEGYMWGIRKLDRPRQFEAAIEALIGAPAAAEFWRAYHENFVTEADIAAMKSWGVNSVRIPLLASQLQPREHQTDRPPYSYSTAGFLYLDRLVNWCDKHDVGVIWDLHGAPGGQNAENISDSDGEARLWTEKEKYWPRCIDLWKTIAQRYAQRKCIIGYDLLNEPLLKRYDGVDPSLLRELYVEITQAIRTIDHEGIIFVEGDEWAQDFSLLEPLDWDPHLVLAFHSYPPTSTAEGLERWDRLRQKYNIPLWHGETGEQRPPYAINRLSTEFLAEHNVGWSWWTHKKYDRMTQPWLCPRTDGFKRILAYWNGEAAKPSAADATHWLMEQAQLSDSTRCVFIPEMVRSLEGLDPTEYLKTQPVTQPRIVQPPRDITIQEGDVASFLALASGGQLKYQWLRDGQPIVGADTARWRVDQLTPQDDNAQFVLRVSNPQGSVESAPARLSVTPFAGPCIPHISNPPQIDGEIDAVWETAPRLPLENIVLRRGATEITCSATARVLWGADSLFILVDVHDPYPVNRDELSYQNDSVEIFLDLTNTKADLYRQGGYRFRYVWHQPALLTLTGTASAHFAAAQADTDTGYVMEFAFPFASLGVNIAPDQFIGFDIHVNDNNGRGRVLKRAWHARRDNAHLSPSHLGTVKLSMNP